ncbi:MAG: DNA polymerase Y family protein [Verrucomicrobiae bacterium]|nr:DNA polymerase Y family protein [Verrucomicrobiae bacterium]
MFAVLHLPDFALQAVLRLDPGAASDPVALVDPGHSTPRVIQRTASAALAGVEEGQTAVQALARCRSVRVRHRSAVQEAVATEALVQVVFGFTPNVEITGPGMLTLDLRGLTALTSKEGDGSAAPLAAWARRLQSAVSGLGLNARVGAGPTPNVARHAARWSDGIERVTDAGVFIGSLPVAALEPSPHVAEILHQWGIRTVGEVLALGQAELAERLGLEAFALFAAASAGAVRPLNLVRPVERFEESLDLELPVETLEPLLFVLRRFAGQIECRLEACGRVAEALHLSLRLESGAVLERCLRVPQPTRAAGSLFRMLHTHLEGVRTDAPITGVGLRADPARPAQHQFSLFEAALRDPNQFQETLARLSALVGADRVGTPVREETHRPGAFRLLPPDFENAPTVPAARGNDRLRPTPMRRCRPALPATVTLQPSDADPAPEPRTVQSPVVSGRITLALGPRRLSGGWWEADGWREESWDVQIRHHQVWRLVCRDGAWTADAVAD